jgi:hypothetical protein
VTLTPLLLLLMSHRLTASFDHITKRCVSQGLAAETFADVIHRQPMVSNVLLTWRGSKCSLSLYRKSAIEIHSSTVTNIVRNTVGNKKLLGICESRSTKSIHRRNFAGHISSSPSLYSVLFDNRLTAKRTAVCMCSWCAHFLLRPTYEGNA